MINVTKTYLPPLAEYTAYLEGIWERNWVTNYGPLMQELEDKLKAYLGVKHLFFVANGTLALQIAIKALELRGEVITTPFSYVATTSSIAWEGCKPIFVDINPQTLCLDASLVERAITAETTAIVATHVYGNPCEVEAIQLLAEKHHLKVLYDAAHAFNVKYKGQSVLHFGHVSTLSFHATKLFHTGEGGAIVTNDDELAYKISYMANFGHDGPERFLGMGINGKNSELHAAMGLCVLPKVEEIIQHRREVSTLYDSLLQGHGLTKPVGSPETSYNYAYYPLLFPDEEKLLAVIAALNAHQIFPRRYFYPALTNLNYVLPQQAPVAQSAAARILCLPLSHDLAAETVRQITAVIIDAL
ncbi:DegT/DnrJ/EryC1/StrS family aminotransferase (plasmid) [Hymenobacter tibetensis]|uniref:DegT/DnrJ/EryC1/StrS family aminotransferase n=1 Tax=Hymenobacter tibetensis TaxID=497967 RepID=A0ABY4D518_9BACT|nr:DegT/DnrJ/EryC1/StrS family aminotransferase [Hymenobacter tibetensis]UOG77601.1 DegT/DnrJ/EryC1/StrS family aminotransferase [Hymenobacter tibetensis]